VSSDRARLSLQGRLDTGSTDGKEGCGEKQGVRNEFEADLGAVVDADVEEEEAALSREVESAQAELNRSLALVAAAKDKSVRARQRLAQATGLTSSRGDPRAPERLAIASAGASRATTASIPSGSRAVSPACLKTGQEGAWGEWCDRGGGEVHLEQRPKVLRVQWESEEEEEPSALPVLGEITSDWVRSVPEASEAPFRHGLKDRSDTPASGEASREISERNARILTLARMPSVANRGLQAAGSRALRAASALA